MFGSTALDVAIGLAAVFLVMGLVSSAMLEVLAGHLRFRAKMLREATCELLDGSERNTRRLYRHPLITSLGGSSVSWVRLWRWVASRFGSKARYEEDDSYPSYIPPATISAALLDLITPTSKTGRFINFWSVRATLNGSTGQIQGLTPPKISLQTDSGLRKTLLILLERAEATTVDGPQLDERRLANLRQQIETWYDQSMERLSGEYKRKTQYWLLAIAMVAALVANIDTLAIARGLNASPALRQAMVQFAGEMTTGEAPASPTFRPTTRPATTAPTTQAWDTKVKELAAVGLPLGWPETATITDVIKPEKLLGIAITGLAASLGAPFWFDLLCKMVNLRATGKRIAPETGTSAEPERTGDETKQGEAATQAPAAANAAPGGAVAVAASLPPSLPADYWEADARARDFVDFKPLAIGLQLANATNLARASLLVYRNERAALPFIDRFWPFTGRMSFDRNGTQCLLAWDDNKVVVAFRGTELTDLRDIVADAKFSLVPAMAGGTLLAMGRVHAGFLGALEQVRAELDAALAGLPPTASPRAIWITGHSLGAALATLYAAWLNRPGSSLATQQLITFGSPRVGDTRFAGYVEKLLTDRVFRFVNHEDAVTRVPCRLVGYAHVGATLYFEASGQLDQTDAGWIRFLNTVIDAQASFRDLATTSVKDHAMEIYVRKLENLT